jgi:hypothetical protein
MSEFATESKSSVAVEANSKGDAQAKVKAYDGVTAEEMDRLSALAVETFTATRARLLAAGVMVP